MQVNIHTKPMDGIDWLWHAGVACFQDLDEICSIREIIHNAFPISVCYILLKTCMLIFKQGFWKLEATFLDGG